MDIDKVAQAIYCADRCGVQRCPRKSWGWDSLDERQRETYRRMAQAAIDSTRAGQEENMGDATQDDRFHLYVRGYLDALDTVENFRDLPIETVVARAREHIAQRFPDCAMGRQ